MSLSRFIVLVSGWSTSGKDTFADILVKKANFKKLNFANQLKKHTSEKYNFDYSLTLSQEGKNTLINSISVRNLLIKEGESLKKEDNINIWAEKLTDEILFYDRINDKRGEIYDNFVISDFRFINEIEYLQKKLPFSKIITIRINRHSKSPIDSITENELNNYKFDFIIDNNKTISDFENCIINSLYFLFD